MCTPLIRTPQQEALLDQVKQLNVLSTNKPANNKKMAAVLVNMEATLEECDTVALEVFDAMLPEIRKLALMSLVAICSLTTE